MTGSIICYLHDIGWVDTLLLTCVWLGRYPVTYLALAESIFCYLPEFDWVETLFTYLTVTGSIICYLHDLDWVDTLLPT